mmetsp:Transcript_34795/g.100783  ORF Transcript_34795/g.100783 Transcript_34795/m.100783 type:complete len:81 (+) Transcript_34795:127-369(+)
MSALRTISDALDGGRDIGSPSLVVMAAADIDGGGDANEAPKESVTLWVPVEEALLLPCMAEQGAGLPAGEAACAAGERRP